MPAHSYIYNKGNASGASSLSTEAAREGERMGGGGGEDGGGRMRLFHLVSSSYTCSSVQRPR